jgi:hypothetical protein
VAAGASTGAAPPQAERTNAAKANSAITLKANFFITLSLLFF